MKSKQLQLAKVDSMSKSKRSVHKVILRGGLEWHIESAGHMALILNFVMAIAVVAHGMSVKSSLEILLGLFIPIVTYFCWLMMRSVAEFLRIQKKLAGLHYDGKITQPEEIVTYACGNCGRVLYNEWRCVNCGAEFDASSVQSDEANLNPQPSGTASAQ